LVSITILKLKLKYVSLIEELLQSG